MSSRYRTLQAQGGDNDEFIIMMDTTEAGTSTDVKLEFLGTATETYDVDWGDGTSNTFTHSGSVDTRIKDYSSSGTYTIKITGNIGQFYRTNLTTDERDALKRILDFGKPANVVLSTNQNNGLQDLSGGNTGRTLTKVRNNTYPHFVANTSCNSYLAQTNCTSTNMQLESWPTTTTANIKFAHDMFFNSIMSNGAANSTIIDLSGWDTSNLVGAYRMFGGVRPGSRDNNNLTIVCSTWDMTSCANISEFASANGGLEIQGCENWDISNCTDIGAFATNNPFFNSNVAIWDTANVTKMDNVFKDASNFNQPIGVWDTSSVTKMNQMLNGATSFNQDISNWNILNMSSFPGMDAMLNDSGMSTENYSKWLISCANQVSGNSDLPSGVFLGAGSIQYNNTTYGSGTYTDAVNARAYLTGTASWNITDGGQA
tara:strand:+ start:139 stop:1422 length:1284 start_codon:yes stop_codon:yes gene_type:complete